MQDDNNRSGNDTDTDDANIRPIYDEEPMAEVQLTAECNIFAIDNSILSNLKIINEGSKTTEQTTSLHANNAELNAQNRKRNHCQRGFTDDDTEKRRLNKMVQASHHNVNRSSHSSKLRLNNSNGLDLLFGFLLFDEYYNGENQVVLKSFRCHLLTDASINVNNNLIQLHPLQL
ncbi:hypothetical protein Tco_0461076 [Tanacetum coccineum]